MNDHSQTITDYAHQSPIPRTILLLMEREEIIRDPLTQEDLIGLHLVEQIWGNRAVLRAQLNRMSLHTRERFIRTVALNSKWERYAYSRYFNQEPESRLSLTQVIEEIQITFRFEMTRKQINRIRKIRTQAQVARHREKKKRNGTISYKAQTKK
ncbi:hypothetical protein [Desulfobulbus sp.]|uniref:hypothetical protein n=1 Tax=Desulfobulbus sp. TaxID=895 RepID=UPI0027BAFEAC|nr:hypothetical protein [Desulfobulbus sp.]